VTAAALDRAGAAAPELPAAAAAGGAGSRAGAPEGAGRFVAGAELSDAAEVIGGLHAGGIAATLGWFAPVAADEATARATARRYAEIAAALADLPAGTNLEIDLPHLGLHVSPGLAVELTGEVAAKLPPGSMIQFGAESSEWTDEVLDVAVATHRRELPVRATLQANLRRTPTDATWLVAEEVPIRLVKGGFPEPARIAYTTPAEIDTAVRRLAEQVTAEWTGPGTGLTVASHDPALQDWAGGLDPVPPVETLLGVVPAAAARLAATRPVRVYVPFGAEDDGYAARRLAEEADVHGLGGRPC
jgi:proline dehydrogenase